MCCERRIRTSTRWLANTQKLKWSTLVPISRSITQCLSQTPHPRDKRARLPVSSSHNFNFFNQNISWFFDKFKESFYSMQISQLIILYFIYLSNKCPFSWKRNYFILKDRGSINEFSTSKREKSHFCIKSSQICPFILGSIPVFYFLSSSSLVQYRKIRWFFPGSPSAGWPWLHHPNRFRMIRCWPWKTFIATGSQ